MNKKNIIGLTLVVTIALLSSCNNNEHGGKKLLYYTDAMSQTMRVSEKDFKKGNNTSPMGMALIPVYEEDKVASDNMQDGKSMDMAAEKTVEVKLSPREEILADISSIEVKYQTIYKMIRSSGAIDFDETRVSFVSAYIGGRIDKLYVNFIGASVYRGQALGKIYSPELVSTQEEYISVLNKADLYKDNPTYTDLVSSARQRLKLWGVSEKDIKSLEETRKPKMYLTLYSPMSGVVIEQNIREGEYVKEGQSLFKIANLKRVWVQTDVYEYELPYVRKGQKVEISSVSFPDRVFTGYITFIDPVINPQTRSIKVRVVINNKNMELKPGMFVTSTLISRYSKRLVIPKSALLDTGIKKVVYIKITNTTQGSIYSPRIVKTGVSDDNVIEVLSGLNEGDQVVKSGAFLLDSQAELSGANSSGSYGGTLDVEGSSSANKH